MWSNGVKKQPSKKKIMMIIRQEAWRFDSNVYCCDRAATLKKKDNDDYKPSELQSGEGVKSGRRLLPWKETLGVG